MTYPVLPSSEPAEFVLLISKRRFDALAKQNRVSMSGFDKARREELRAQTLKHWEEDVNRQIATIQRELVAEQVTGLPREIEGGLIPDEMLQPMVHYLFQGNQVFVRIRLK